MAHAHGQSSHPEPAPLPGPARSPAHGGSGGGGGVHAAGASEALHHHGHTIVPASTLMGVLLALLFFTLLTVGASKAELFISHTFNWHIPPLFNVAVALSIAVIKTSLVVLFFMQLKYDNPVNGMIFIFCVITVAFFLGFTMLDLGNRGTIDRFKSVAIIEGGTGLQKENKPITAIAKDAAVQNHTFDQDAAHHGGHGESAHAGPERSSPQRSRPIVGLPVPEGEAGAHAEPGPGTPAPATTPATTAPPAGGHSGGH